MGHVDWEGIRRNVLAFSSNQLTEQPTEAGLALRRFWSDPESGIVSEPRIRTWMPQRPVDASWQSPIPSLPPGFWPYEFQAKAFDRLSVAGQLPRPTAIAAPEGSGKSECFLLPILDHCARQQGLNRAGVKAVIVYASRASASENASRMGSICQMFDRFRSLRPGLLIDDFGSTTSIGNGHVIDSVDAMTSYPPDILLTVPEMLNRTLQSQRLSSIWAGTTPVSLRYIVVDDIHFYTDEGIQDLAILLRRFGARLGMASPTQPLGGAVPIVTAGVSVPLAAAPNATEGATRTPPTGPPPGHPPMPPTGGARSTPGSIDQQPDGQPRSGLPRPSTAARSGAGGLPDLSSVSASDPTAGLGGKVPAPAGQSPPGLRPLEDGSTADVNSDHREQHPLLDLAEFLFGVEFKADSLIVESAMTPEQLCPAVVPTLPIPSASGLASVALSDHTGIFAQLFGSDAVMPTDAAEWSRMMCTHPLVLRLLTATHEQAVDAAELAERIGLVEVGAQGGRDGSYTAAVQRIVELLITARLPVGANAVPLVRVDAELPLGSMGRVMRLVANAIEFVGPDDVDLDDPAIVSPPGVGVATLPPVPRHYLPAVACQNCGASGWLGSLLGHEHQRVTAPIPLWAPMGEQTGNPAILMVAADRSRSTDDQIRLLDPGSLDLDPATSERSPGEGSGQLVDTPERSTGVPVTVVSGSPSVTARICPVCAQQGSVEFIGSEPDQILAHVTTDLVSSSSSDRQRVIVLTDSREMVDQQLASLSEREYTAALHNAIISGLGDAAGRGVDTVTPAELADIIIGTAVGPAQRRRLIPAGLLRDGGLASLLADQPTPEDLAVLRNRLEFEIVREFGQRSTAPNSLSSTGRTTARIATGVLDGVVGEVLDAVPEESGLRVDPEKTAAYLLGLLERLRLDGAIDCTLMHPFVLEDGDPAFVTDRRPSGLPELSLLERPRFLTTAARGSFESIDSIHRHAGGARTWPVEWACNSLGVNASEVPAITRTALEAMATNGGPLLAMDAMDGHRVYGLSTSSLVISTDVRPTGPENGDLRDESDPSTRVSTASTVGSSPVDKARAEWSFKYGPAGDAPDVLYMSAGHVRSDRDVVDTTIDLAGIDILLADMGALRRLGTVPEVRRVGIGSGSGLVILIEPATESGAVESVGAGKNTSASLPPVPQRLRTTPDDYVMYLFDRIVDGSIDFPHPFETLGQMMSVAHAVPDAADRSPDTPGPAPDTAPPMVEPPSSWSERATTSEALPMLSEQTTRLMTDRSDDVPLFDVIVGASAATMSLTKATPLDDFLRTVAVDNDPAEASVLKEFAKSGVGPYLEQRRETFDRAADDGAHGERLSELPWSEGLLRLRQRIDGGHAKDRRGVGLDEQSAGVVADDRRTEGQIARGWALAGGAMTVARMADPDERLLVRLPVLNVQGAVRTRSVVAAIAVGIEQWLATDSIDKLLDTADGSPPVSVTLVPEMVAVDGGKLNVGQLTITSSLPVILDELVEPEQFKHVIEHAIRNVAQCPCADSGRSACPHCLLSVFRSRTVGSVPTTAQAKSVVSVLIDSADTLDATSLSHARLSVSRDLALEVLGVVVEQWNEVSLIDQLPDSVPDQLVRGELARAFELSLKVWLQRAADVMGRMEVTDAASGRYRISITFDGDERLYDLARREPVTGTIRYRIEPVDAEWPVVTLMLEPLVATRATRNDTAPDPMLHDILTKMADGRSGTDLRWLLTWRDVQDFYDAVVTSEAADTTDRSLVDPDTRERAASVQQSAATRVTVGALEQTPLPLLLDLLARPWRHDWQIAASALLDAAGHTRDMTDAVDAVLWTLIRGLAATL